MGRQAPSLAVLKGQLQGGVMLTPAAERSGVDAGGLRGLAERGAVGDRVQDGLGELPAPDLLVVLYHARTVLPSGYTPLQGYRWMDIDANLLILRPIGL